ncbi:MAG: class I SAM-dependent methyltransferase [Thermodesulfobacteriota bacterium]
MPLLDDSHRQIAKNKEIHDRIASQYDAAHPEIYNPTEQTRIHAGLANAISLIQTGAKTPVVMDFGAGTGNLTNHLLDLGVRVLAADVSQGSLDLLKEKLGHPAGLQTALLNGRDLAGFGDQTVDMLATYSVLHHVPDYLAIISEFVRVVKPGGIILIDHEVCPAYWEQSPEYLSYLNELGGNFLNTYGIVTGTPLVDRLPLPPTAIRILRTLYRTTTGISGRVLEMTRLRKHRPGGGGDIHIFQHDHIEWDRISTQLAGPCEIVREEDYLVCRETDPNPPVWHRWRQRCSDMRSVTARRISS